MAALPGKTLTVQDGEVRFLLFIPDRYVHSRELSLTIHFHGASWFAIQEHHRRGLTEPLICFENGQGSNAYKRPFEDRERFRRWIEIVEKHFRSPVVRVDVSSYSAGYGAVREILKSLAYVRVIRRIVLADSMYAGFEPIFPGASAKRPAQGDMEPWILFAKLAAQGKKEFVLTHSQVATDSYANSVICARWLAMKVGASTVIVPRREGETVFPLLTRADRGGFHVWGYGGVDADAHMAHPRHIAEIWQSLDQAGEMQKR